MGIYALAQYVQDLNPNLAAGAACAIIDHALTGPLFSAMPTAFGRSKGLQVSGAVTKQPITVYNRCFNNNQGSAKFYVDGKYSAYTKIDRNLYSCSGKLTHQFEYGTSLRVLNADNTLFAVADQTPSTKSSSTFRDASNTVIATLVPSAMGSGLAINILNTNTTALPLVMLAAAAFAQFTSSALDECNGFVLAGGIIDIILLSLLASYTCYIVLQYYRKRGQLPKQKYYEPDAVVEHANFGADGRHEWGAQAHHRNHKDEAASAADSSHHYRVPPAQPQPVAVPTNTSVLIQLDDLPNFSQPQSIGQQQKAAPHPAVSFSPAPQLHALPRPENPPSPPAVHVPSAAPANPLPQNTMTYWQSQDLREKLSQVGYTKLKRYLALHNVNCPATLLKDELITLAIIHRSQIDFSPLISQS
jgi:hypothetical protein